MTRALTKKSLFTWLLTLSVFFVLLGRGLQHLYWDAPYRALLWDQALLEKPLSWMGIQWQSFVQNLNAEILISQVSTGLGIFAFTTGMLALLSMRKRNIDNRLFRQTLFRALYVATAWLIFLAFLYSKSKGYRIGQFIEYASQFLAPLALVWLLKGKTQHLQKFFPIAISLTFLGHGLYAIGYYPQPGHFIDMTIAILGVTEQTARNLLKVAGALDIAAAVLIFHPKYRMPAVYFCIAWGTLTAFARVTAGINFSQFWDSLFYYLPATIYRLPHGLVPLAYWAFLKHQKMESNAPQTSGVFATQP